jgi:sensor histidine kinase YesM
MAEKIQRKIIFIKKKFQLKIVAFVMLCVLFATALITYEFLSLLQDIFSKHPALLQSIFEEGSSLVILFLIKIAICFIVILLFTALLSNKIAGPIYRFEEAFKQVAQGNKKVRVSLRQGDTLRDLEKGFNEMMDILDDSNNTEEEK